MRVSKALQAFVFLLLFLSAAGDVFGQAGNGGIGGLVTDSSGAALPGTKVKIENTATGVTFIRTANGAGAYHLGSVPPAVYQVTFSHKGFTTSVHNNVVVTVDQVTTVNAALAVGAIQQVVTVNAGSQLISASSSTVGQLIDEKTINRVPLLTRDVYQLVQLTAGVTPTDGVPNASDTTAVFNLRPEADVASYTANGASPGSLQFMVDGSPISVAENNLGALIPAMQIPLDAVQEYRVETQNTPASFESGGAGVISLVTKSGTNHFHGDGFVYIRPNVLSANDYFLKQGQLASGEPNKPLGFHRYQEGGSIGGPILHRKLFFFSDYEATQQETVQTGTYTFPTAAERSGDFSADSYTIYNPLVPDLPNGTRQAFPGNKIPSGDINPVAKIYSSHFPAPTSAGIGPYHLDNYFASGLDPNKAQKFDVRIDGYQGEKQHIFGRFSFARLLVGDANLYGSANTFNPYWFQNVVNERNFLLADAYSISPNTLLQLRYSFTRHFENQTGDPRQTGFDMTSVGFPSSLAAQQTYKDAPFMSFAQTSDLGTFPYYVFRYASEDPFDIIASLQTTKGRHTLEVGFEVEKQFMNEGQPIAPSGWYQFDNTATSSTTFAGDGSDYASFLLGMGSAPGFEFDNFTKDLFGAQANPYYAAYIEDSYRVTSNFTLNVGLRWDIFGGRTERHNRLEYFDPNVKYTVNGVPLVGGEQFVGNGRSRSPFTTNMKDFGPRAGFAWKVAPTLVFRGGAGIYYGPSTQMVANSALNSDGFSSVTDWVSSAYNADGNTVMVNPLNNPFPEGVVQLTGSRLGPATNIGDTLSTELHSQRTPTTYDFNFGFENQFAHGILLAVAYVGSRGRFLPLGSVDLNQLSLQTIGEYKEGLNTPVPNKWEAIYPPSSPFAGQPTVPQFLALESYPQFTCGAINCGVAVNGYPAATSSYDSLQTKVQKRLSSHITGLATFTWSKLLTDDYAAPLAIFGFNGSAAQDWRNLEFEHSVSQQDVPLSFTGQISYDLPIGRGRALNLSGWKDQAAGGWTLNGILYLNDGEPIAAPNGTGNPFFNQRVDQVCNPGARAPRTSDEWFSYQCFAEPASKFVAGTAPRLLGSIRTDGARDLDVSVYKNFHLGGERNLQLQVSSYNLTNTPQFGYPAVFWNPNPTPANMAGFGKITSDSNTPRQFQFSSRFTF